MRKIGSRLIILFFIYFIGVQFSVQAQNGSIDPSFVIGSGFNNLVRATAIQSDGKLIVAGDFTSFNGTSINRIARLNTNGTLDNTFSVGTGFNRSVNAIYIQPDGKVIVGGVFTNYNGTTRNRIIRLNTNGSIDNTFNVGTGCNNNVNAIAYQTDGKVILAGDFTSYNGTTRNRIIRINSNGIIDNTFSIGSGLSSTVNSISLQPDGKVIAAGNFTSYNGTARNRLVRINTNGTIDNTLAIGTGFNQEVFAVAVQPDGKLIIGGSFTSYNGSSRNRIVRIASSGSIDNILSIGTGFANTVRAIAIQPDGLILAGGSFTAYNGSTQNRISRLNPDGSIDPNLVTGTGFSGAVYSFSLQSNGWLYAGGSFANYNGVSSNNISKIDAFVCPPSVSISAIPSNSICSDVNVTFNAVSTNGGVSPTYQWYLNNNPVGSNSSSYSNNTISNNDQIKVLMTSSAACASFAQVQSNTITMSVSTSVSPTVSIAAIPNQVICSGTTVTFDATTTYPGTNPTYQWYLNGTPVGSNTASYFNNNLNNNDQISVQLTSNATCAQPKTVSSNIAVVQVSATLAPTITISANNTNICQGTSTTFTATPINAGSNPTFTFLVNGNSKQSGTLNTYSTSTLNNNDVVSCLLTNAVPGNQGTLDASYTIGTGLNVTTTSQVIQPDGKVIIAGDFTTFNGTTKNRIVRLNADGSVDNTFNIGTGFNRIVHGLAIQPDGKVIVVGNFTTFNGISINRIVRLNSNGSLDNTFITGTGFNNDAWAVYVQTNGYVVIGGDFTTYNGTSRNRIVRLAPTGSIDNTFSVGTGYNSTVYTITAQSNGKILVGGDFTSYNGNVRNRITRLNYDGTLDNTFTSGAGFNLTVYALAVQTDGKILSGGNFTSYNTTSINRIVRINSDGSFDNTFAVGTGFNNIIRSIVVQTNDMVIAGGDFTTYNGISRNRIVRITSTGSIDNNFIIGTGFNGSVYSISFQSDGKIIASGDFTTYNGNARNRILRIQNALCFSTSALSNSIAMTVNPNVIPSVSIAANPGNVICQGKEVTFSATPVNGGSSPSYQWYLNGNLVGTNSNLYQNNSLVTNDQVYVRLSSNASCVSPSQVNSAPVIITANTDCGTDPASQASQVQTLTNQTKSMTISWNVGYWDKRVVFVKKSDLPDVAVPSNGTTYNANSVFGQGTQIGTTGWYCVYNGSENSVTVSGLRPYTKYQTMVLEYHGNPGAEIYNISSTTNNPITLVTLGVIPQDFNVLKTLYKSLGGNTWTNNWDTLSNSVSSSAPWTGITVGPYDPINGIDLEDRITQISLPSNALTGSLPAEIGLLSELTYLNLPKNNIVGQIPSGIGSLTKLSYLNLNNNKLTGSIPAEIGNLTNLTNLHLAYNQLSGEIPSELGNLTNLIELVLSNNQLTGSIPKELGNLNRLTRLGLPNNQLSGSIPSELGNLSSLTRMVLSFNTLTGSIPRELGNLTKLTSLGLTDNSLSGEIPVEFGNLVNLTELNLYMNQLTGNIPAELGNLSKLETLNLSNNNLSGEIPVQIRNLTKLKKLYLSYNNFTSIPDVTNINFDMTSGSGLNVQNNNLTFSSLIPIKTKFFTSSQYNPQKPFGLSTVAFGFNTGDNITLDVTNLSTQNLGSGNTYSLYKGTKLVKGSSVSGIFTLSNVAAADTGTYYFKVSNSQLTGITLVSVPFKINLVKLPNKLFNVDSEEVIVVSAISAYPNPTRGAFNLAIRSEYNGEIKINILNSIGQVITSNQYSKNLFEEIYNLSIDEPTGIYFIEIIQGEKRESLKILKQ